MTLIAGIGDEVLQFVAVVLAIVVATLAWLSTNARPNRYRTVLVMRSQTRHPVTVSIRTRTATVSTRPPTNMLTPPASAPVNLESSTAAPQTEEVHRERRVIPLQEMDSIADADVAMMNNNRMHFYRRVENATENQSASESTSDESETAEEPEPAGNAQIREMDSIVSAMEADGASDPFNRTAASTNTSTISGDKPDGPHPTETPIAEVTSEQTQGASILIKLKYLNDTLKEVDGRLDEQLKDFKWRHFSTELSAQSRVVLIFNGRVLSENATLRACGLHHQAVVHCLVHPNRNIQRNTPEESPLNGVNHELVTETAQPERTWDLENILMTLVSVALTVVWFFRCEYSNMFTASASVALFGLTVFYSVAIFGLYLSDTFHFERRPPPAVPDN